MSGSDGGAGGPANAGRTPSRATHPKVNGDRLWANLNELFRIGATERGVCRLAFTPSDMEGRRWLLRKIEAAGLDARMDEVGNVFGRLESHAVSSREGGPDPTPRKRLPAILVGSHIDTVPEGGMFDGALGVLGGFECLQSIKDAELALRHPLELAAFANEEGSRIIPGTFGSRAFCLGIPQDEWTRVLPVLRDAGLGHAQEGQGAWPTSRGQTGSSGATGPGGQAVPGIPGPSFRPEEYLAYLELHIEQGGILEAAGEAIGVVQGIVCIAAFNAVFRGEANHAGTTPMGMRKDALLGAAELVLAVPEAVRRLGSPSSVGTCGQISVKPGGRNVIPGEAEISVEVRDLDRDVASRVVAAIEEEAERIAARRGLGLEISRVSLNQGAAMDRRIQDVIEAAARDLGLPARRMPSGAGHDAMNLAKRGPAGMIFVPSRGGISHSPREWTSKEQCCAGVAVLLRTIMALDSGEPGAD